MQLALWAARYLDSSCLWRERRRMKVKIVNGKCFFAKPTLRLFPGTTIGSMSTAHSYPLLHVLPRTPHRIVSPSSGAELIAGLRKLRVKDRCQHLQERLLDQAAHHGGDPQHPLASPGFRDFDPAHGLRSVDPRISSKSCACASLNVIRQKRHDLAPVVPNGDRPAVDSRPGLRIVQDAVASPPYPLCAAFDSSHRFMPTGVRSGQ